MGVANLSRRQFLAGSAAAGVSLSLDNLVLGHSKTPVSAEFLAMLSALNSIQDKREKVPDDSKLKEAEKELQKLFAEQYKSRKADFADVLLKAVSTETGDKRYVMLRDSAQISAENFKLPTSFAALEKMVDTYQVKFDPISSDVLKTAKKGAKSPEQNAEYAELGIKLADLGMKWNEYDAAVRAVNESKSVAGKSGDKSLVDKTNEKLKEVTLLKKEFDDYVKAEDGLSKITFEDTVNDPKKKADFERFNLIAGKWQCFKEDKWNIGIYMLPLGSDKDLASIAQKEQKLFESKVALTAENFYDLAEAWYAKTKKEPDQREKAKYGTRALHWYDRTLETATGALKAKTETRIGELGALVGGSKTIIDLLKMIDPAKDAVAGKWESKNGHLLSEVQGSSRIQIPYSPPEEYDLRVTFTPLEGLSDTKVILSKSGRPFAYAVAANPENGGMPIAGFELIKGERVTNNPSGVKLDRQLKIGQTYTIVVQVRKDGLKSYQDNVLVSQWKTADYKDMTLLDTHKLNNESLIGISTYKSAITYNRIEIIQLTGNGKRLR